MNAPIFALLVLAVATSADPVVHSPAPHVVTAPDLAPMPREAKRRLPFEARFDFGARDGAIMRQVAVAEGDTFASIAERRYGRRDAAAQLAALNPGVDGSKLVTGTMLWLPPQGALAAAAGAYAAFTTDFGITLTPLVEGQPTMGMMFGRLAVVLVPVAELAAVQQTGTLPADAAARGILVAATDAAGARVAVGSTAHRVLQTWALVERDGGHQLLRTAERFVDANGDELDATTARGDAPQSLASWPVALTLSVFGGLFFGAQVARRRRAAAATA